MYHRTEKRLDILRFDSLHEQQEDLAALIPKLRLLQSGHTSVAQPQREAQWIGRRFSSIEDYIKAANETSDEDMMIFDMMLAQLRKAEITPPKDMRRVRAWNEDDGEEVDLDRLRVGKPFWETHRRANRLGPVTVTIMADLAAGAWRDSHTIGWRGAVAVCLTELLEAAGYRVELWAVTNLTSYTYNYRNLLLGVCLKQPDMPLDLVPTINAVTGWYKRTVSFASYHASGETVSTTYGRPARITREAMQEFSNDEHILLCEEVWSESESIRLATKLIESLNTRFGESE